MEEKKLNKQQLEAVGHGSGPLLIVAGAGTGKTTVVAERVKWLISQNQALPGEILALTFTEKAAREMEERIDVALPYGYTQMWIMTFHSFCDRILRDEGLAIGLDTGFKLLTEANGLALFKKHLFNFDLDYFRPLGNPAKFIAAILQHFSRLADEDVDPQEYARWAKSFAGEETDKKKWLELAAVYRQWTDLKTKEGLLEFGDLITLALKLFRNRPNVLSKYHQKFKYLLVDEFQDTNYAQNLLVNLLAGENKNLTVVADDDQAIYRWRGAAVSNVIQFRRAYPSAKLVTLIQNYRSTQEILDRAYDLIRFNNPDRLEVKEKIDKKLISVREIAGDKIEYLHLDRVENEAETVVKKISELKSQDAGLSWKDFAILVRANNHADPFVGSFQRHGLPHQFLGPGQLFAQPEIKDLIAYLKVLYNFGDNASFYRVLAMPVWDIPPRELAALTNFAKNLSLSLFEAAEKIASSKLTPVLNLVNRHLKMMPVSSAGQILYDFLEKSGLIRLMLDDRPPITEVQAKNIAKFFDKIRSFEVSYPDSGVLPVVDWLDLSMQLGESPLAADIDWTQNDAVNILTVHSAKGLEFKIVFLVNLVAQRFPTSERREPIPIPDQLIKEILPEGDYHLQEERRLFYVGMTRAQNKLFFTAADFYGEGKREKKISPFISEALGSKFSKIQPAADQLSILDWKPLDSPPAAGPARAVSAPINYLSYSQIQTFLGCPLHYRAKYILKIPTPPTAALSFGTAIHATLKEFLSDPGQDILSLFKKHWTSEGFLSQEHEKQYLAKGKNILADFQKSGYDPRNLSKVLEKNFTIPLTPTFKIGGKIDRVDVLPGGRIEIIDYKTGSIPKQKEKDIADDLQLSFYALAATTLKETPFNRTPDQIQLTLYYLEEQKKITSVRTSGQLEEAKQKILSYADQISKSDFKCSGGPLCKSCEYSMLCDVK